LNICFLFSFLVLDLTSSTEQLFEKYEHFCNAFVRELQTPLENYDEQLQQLQQKEQQSKQQHKYKNKVSISI
jgi:hypothetical protein